MAISSHGQGVKIWTGSATSNWNHDNNWIPASVPGALDQVIIPSNAINNAVLPDGSSVTIKQIAIENDVILNISINATLNIEQPISYAIYNAGSIINKGTINIGQDGVLVNDAGLRNDGGYIQNTGTINIDNVALYGIRNYNVAEFINEDLIQIGQNGGNINMAGIINQDNGTTFLNDGGTINIGQAGLLINGTGLSNDAGYIQNTGTINIDNVTKDALVNYNGAEFENEDLIQIGQTGGTIGMAGIFNHDDGTTFFNNEGTISIGIGGVPINGSGLSNDGSYIRNTGTINIDNVADDALINYNGAEFENEDLIKIGQNGGNIGLAGLFNRDFETTFLNNGGTIQIDNTDGDGISNLYLGVFKNENNGLIKIGQNGTVSVCIKNSYSATFINLDGELKLDRTATQNRPAIWNRAIFYNYSNGLIRLGQIVTNNDNIHYGIDNAQPEGGFVTIFSNEGGTIYIDNTLGPGIINRKFAEFNNLVNGQVNIGNNTGNIGTAGLWCKAGNVTNNNSTINIKNTSGNSGVICDLDGSYTNINNAQLLIGQNGGSISNSGISIETLDNSFTNDGSTIKIDNTNTHGIKNNGFFFNKNGSQINIGQEDGNIGENGIYNFSLANMYNDGSTILIDQTSTNGINNSNSSFENKNGGEILIGFNGPIGVSGIVNSNNSGQMINDASSTITTYSEFRNENNAQFTNNGVLHCR